MIREIPAERIAETVAHLCIQACCDLPGDVVRALVSARDREEGLARELLDQLVQNQDLARKKGRPCCQDTGLAVVFLDVGQDCHIEGDLTAAVDAGVAKGYTEGFLRKSLLTALGRANTGDNTPAVLHVRLVPGDRVRVTVAPKGFGSENMSRIGFLAPAAGRQGVEDFVVETVRLAGGNPCPPVVVAVGIGGTVEACAELAKRQLLRPLDQPSPDGELAAMERRLLGRINALGIGPMGFGGKTTALAVLVAERPAHLASLPVAVNIQCHCCRHAEAWI